MKVTIPMAIVIIAICLTILILAGHQDMAIMLMKAFGTVALGLVIVVLALFL